MCPGKNALGPSGFQTRFSPKASKSSVQIPKPPVPAVWLESSLIDQIDRREGPLLCPPKIASFVFVILGQFNVGIYLPVTGGFEPQIDGPG